MCVIAVKKKGVAMPSNDSIKLMWETNSDGAGFMYALNGKVFIEKGFMKLTDLTRAIINLEKFALKSGTSVNDIPVILHFRIATHGGTSAELTHPFPISHDEKHLKALDLTCDLGMAHNGIINSVETLTNGGLSDTQVYITDVLAPLNALNGDFYKSQFGKDLMENTIGWSKLAFLDKDGNVELVGDFKRGTKDNTSDILFSNLSHEYPKTAHTLGGHGYYGSEDAYYNDFGYYGYKYKPETPKKMRWEYDEDFLKPLSVSDKLHLSPIEVITEKSVVVDKLQPINTDDTWFMNMDGEVFLKSKFGGVDTYVQSTTYARVVRYVAEEKKVYVMTWEALKAPNFIGKIRAHDNFIVD